MSSKRFLLISIVVAISALICAGCNEKTPSPAPGDERDESGGIVRICVYDGYVITEVEAPYGMYSSWTEFICGEFDGRDAEHAEAHWRGDYITAIGSLRPEDPSGIAIYLNGKYSTRFVRYCEYRAGYTLAFAKPGVAI